MPPAMLERVGVSAIRPSPLLPVTVMLPDAMTVWFTWRPAVIRIFPAAVVSLRALASTRRLIVTSPSDWTVRTPPPAPLTSTGLLRAAGATATLRPPAPSVSVIMPAGRLDPPDALSRPLVRMVSLAARISNAFEPPMKFPVSVISRVPKSNVHTPPGVVGATATVRLMVPVVASNVHDPPQPAITSAAVHTAPASRAAATRTSASTPGTQRVIGTPPSCRCGTGRAAPSSCSSSRSRGPPAP